MHFDASRSTLSLRAKESAMQVKILEWFRSAWERPAGFVNLPLQKPAARAKTCPPCSGNCLQGHACPARTPMAPATKR
jgi:hypothetical protein